jgi:hypothetical protein
MSFYFLFFIKKYIYVSKSGCHTYHPTPITLNNKTPISGFCNYIAHMKCANQLVHLVEGMKLAKEQTTSPREINHFSHPQHNLIFINEKFVNVKRCEACTLFIISNPFCGRAQCNFFLHYICTKLPATITRGLFYRHPLTLHSQDVNASGLFWCGACKRTHNGFVYKCDECKVCKFGVQCCLIPKILEHEGHQHSISMLGIECFQTCNGCGEKSVNFTSSPCVLDVQLFRS